MTHHYYTEKIFFGSCNLVASAASLLGAIMGPEDARWIYVTLSVGIMVSTALALMTRRNEPMSIIAGRSLFAVLVTILGTRGLVHWMPSLAAVKEDAILLGFISGCVTIAAFTIGYGFIRSLNDNKLSLGRSLKDLLIFLLTPKK